MRVGLAALVFKGEVPQAIVSHDAVPRQMDDVRLKFVDALDQLIKAAGVAGIESDLPPDVADGAEDGFFFALEIELRFFAWGASHKQKAQRARRQFVARLGQPPIILRQTTNRES